MRKILSLVLILLLVLVSVAAASAARQQTGNKQGTMIAIGPKFNLTAPKDGAVWTVGTAQNITWDAAKADGAAKLLLYKGNTLIWKIATDVKYNKEAYGYYLWNIPDDLAAGDGYHVEMVSVSDSTATKSISGTFRIAPKKTLAISGNASGNAIGVMPAITTPTAGMAWTAGVAQNIMWGTAKEDGTAKLLLYKENKMIGAIAENVKYAKGKTGWYKWTIPDNLAGSGYHIEMVSTSNSAVMKSVSGDFTIKMKVTLAVSPGSVKNPLFTVKAFQSYDPNQPHERKMDIIWRAWSSGKANLLLYRGNTLITTIAQNLEYSLTDNAGKEYFWPIPGWVPVGDNYHVEMVSTADSKIKSVSDSGSIVDFITVTSPSQGAVWKPGQTYEIKWNFSSASALVDVWLMASKDPDVSLDASPSANKLTPIEKIATMQSSSQGSVMWTAPYGLNSNLYAFAIKVEFVGIPKTITIRKFSKFFQIQ